MGRINILPILQIVHYNILNPTPPWTFHCLVRFSSPSLFKLPYDPFHPLFFYINTIHPIPHFSLPHVPSHPSLFTPQWTFPSLSFHFLMFLHIPHSSLPSEPSHHSLFTSHPSLFTPQWTFPSLSFHFTSLTLHSLVIPSLPLEPLLPISLCSLITLWRIFKSQPYLFISSRC